MNDQQGYDVGHICAVILRAFFFAGAVFFALAYFDATHDQRPLTALAAASLALGYKLMED